MTGRVLVTASTLSHIRNFHLPYLERFHALGYQVDVACAAPAGELPAYVSEVLGLPFEKKLTAPGNFKAAGLLRRRFRTVDYDLVVTHTALAAFFTRLALPRSGKRPRVVNMVHGYFFDPAAGGLKNKLLLNAERLTASRADLVLTMNAADLAIARQYRLAEQVRSIPGVGVDFSRLDPGLAQDRSALRAAEGIPRDAFVFLYPAEFSARKNQALLIHALTRLPERAALVLPGQGALLSECSALAQKLGVSHRVFFPGQVADMGRWYALADAAVTASHSEGLPFNVMEAMYAGLPIAATAVKGHTDLLVPEETGLLFPDGDVDACAGAMDRLLNDAGLRTRLGQAAHPAALPYALDQVLPLVMDQYLSLVKTPAMV